MVNNEFKKWLELASIIHKTVPEVPNIHCPNCSSINIQFEYIGDVDEKKGYFLLWCNDCLKGIHISRIHIPQKANIISFKASNDEISHIPKFHKISPE